MSLPTTAKSIVAILTLVDFVSRMAHSIPTRTTATTEDILDLLADRLARYQGLPT